METIKTSVDTSDPPHNDLTSFEALRELKESENNHQIIKNRIEVLKMHEQRNLKKIQTQQNRISKILEVRDLTAKDKEKNSLAKKKISREMENQRIINRENKKHIEDKIQLIKNNIISNKLCAYRDCQQKRIKNEQKIKKEREETLLKKQEVRDKVVEMEEQSKEHILQYISKKSNTVHNHVKSETNSLLKKRQNKEKQILKSSLVEMELIKKFSESQVAYKEAKNKLDVMLGNLRKENRENKEKMKSIMKEKQPESSFYGKIG